MDAVGAAGGDDGATVLVDETGAVVTVMDARDAHVDDMEELAAVVMPTERRVAPSVVFSGHEDAVYSVATHEGLCASGGHDDRMLVWRADSGDVIACVEGTVCLQLASTDKTPSARVVQSGEVY